MPLSSYSQFLSTCQDTDSGNNINQAGTLTLSSIFRTVTKKDFCSQGQLIEYFCNGNKIGFEIKTCPQGYNCYQGACISANQQPTTQQPQSQQPICTAEVRRCSNQENAQRGPNCEFICPPGTTLINPPAVPITQPPQQPSTPNYEGSLRFSTGPENLGNYAFELGGKSIGLKAILSKGQYSNMKTPLSEIHYSLEVPHLSNYMYQNYRYNIIDYNKDSFDDFSANDGGGSYAGRFYLFKGVSKTIKAQQELNKIGINMNGDYSKFHFWKDLDKDGYEDLVLHVGRYNMDGLRLYWNNKDGTFTPYKSASKGPVLYSNSQFEDINGDDLPDLINDLNIYFNDGNRGFTAGKATGLPSTQLDSSCMCRNIGITGGNSGAGSIISYKVVISDLDNDQDNDLLFANERKIFLAQNNRIGEFKVYDLSQITTGSLPELEYDDGTTSKLVLNTNLMTLRTIDFDGDGDKDIYLGYVISGVIYENLLIP